MTFQKGISSKDAKAKLLTFGFNELPTAQPKNIFHISLEVMKEPMFLLLISCAILYLILGDQREGYILFSSISLIIGITFYQYRKTERALEALKSLSSPRAIVIRDGIETRIPGREVVQDDILILSEGDRVPADAEILETTHILIDESMLTGESLPVNKSSNLDQNKVYSGTLILQGRAIAKVLKTGKEARLGKIATSIKDIKVEATRLQSEMKTLIRRLGIIGIFLSLSVVVLYYITKGNFIQSLLNGLAAAMAILPEEFPVVMTVFLALGAWKLSKKNVLTRKSSAIETLGSATVLCSDKTGTITENKMELVGVSIENDFIAKESFETNKEKIEEIIYIANCASSAHIVDPMEKAIRAVSQQLYTTQQVEELIIKEYPLQHELKAMTRVIQQKNKYIIACKGSPEDVLKLCKLSPALVEKKLNEVQQLAEKGYRILGVAKSIYIDDKLPETQNEFNYIFCGFICLEDPVRKEVPQAIKECEQAGVKVNMITGDFPATAKSIAIQAGLNPTRILTGDEIDQMNDSALRTAVKETNIYARVIPEQKLRIVEALKANGEIVAMTGDGVNDAPALQAAHIGIAMGNKGTDVAREAASLVLLDDNFASIVSAIRLGRRIFDNLQKAMTYILAIHIPIIGLTLLPALFPTLQLFLLPLHIVFMELIIDPVCSVAFESEAEEKGIMQRLPRKASDKFFGKKRLLFSIFQGLLLLAMVIIVYIISIKEGHTEGEVRAIAFSSLIIGNIFLILSNLSNTKYFISVILEKNITVISILSVACIMLFCIIRIPALQSIFSFEFPGYHHFLTAFLGAFIMLIVLEIIKYIRNRKVIFG